MIRVAAGVCLVLALIACSGIRGSRVADSGGGACTGGPEDSSKAAHVVLDTLQKLDGFPSAIYRFAKDSSGFRLVTSPAPGQVIIDGMAIVRLDPRCQIVSIVQTDSA